MHIPIFKNYIPLRTLLSKRKKRSFKRSPEIHFPNIYYYFYTNLFLLLL